MLYNGDNMRKERLYEKTICSAFIAGAGAAAHLPGVVASFTTLPVIGIPLPFFSYGGSSLWSFTILIFIFLRLDANRLQVFR